MDRFAPIVSDSIFATSILFDASVNAGVIQLEFQLAVVAAKIMTSLLIRMRDS